LSYRTRGKGFPQKVACFLNTNIRKGIWPLDYLSPSSIELSKHKQSTCLSLPQDHTIDCLDFAQQTNKLNHHVPRDPN